MPCITKTGLRVHECVKRIPLNGVFLEIGVWRGTNMAAVLAKRPDVTGICVDPWAKAEGSYATSGSTDSKISADHWTLIHTQAVANLYLYRDRVSIVRMRARDFVARALKEKYDVIFIDGDHSYDGCAEDIADWRKKAGVWIGGHDYDKPQFPGVKKAVDEAFKGDVTFGADSTWWHEVKA